MEEFYSIISKETGISVPDLKKDCVIKECINERYLAWIDNNKDSFYVDIVTEDVYSTL